ncbi:MULTISPECIES: nicotinate-nicotinamide nucleotide adenylyltransferase [Vibrio]|uniref:nicotinate-nucleotide adenylyltransferase n=1 Tax=Vibrio casei TaxID=673372 RepID=A0A368LI38_9VIBR|nr:MULTISPECIES: nicotinate-nicotinamide nucleotide adenylyltransferase [Vibrio]RCS70285.1 nicotinate-nicotinamide nucleotide adenylyltransferase [Vibrio casei]SJN19639.1 Nicotinate-nucleotide adenylyltransferase [Vibrio casei]HBV77389.1 nicotinate-nicotinamide nucleotide adenylyltransferase [Vibrio sp.]
MKSNIAIFGSAFNPPSLGHKSVLDSLTHFDQVILVPSIAHAWGKNMLPFEIRCQMIEKFLIDINLPNAMLSRIEEELHQPGDSVTTFSLLNKLQQQYSQSRLTFVIGPDNFTNFSKFYKAEEIMRQWSVLACPETLPIRSTRIREQCSGGGGIDDLTTPSVSDFIQQQRLYRS